MRNTSKERPTSSAGHKVKYKKVGQNRRQLVRNKKRSKTPSGVQESADMLHVVTGDIKSEGAESSPDPSISAESPLSVEANVLSCSVCGKSFANKSDLFVHLRTHSDELPYSCTECGMCFSQERSLRLHRQFHAGDRRYRCSECGKSYNHKKLLYNHQRLHMSTRPISCYLCDKQFGSKQTFILHERVHTGEQPYVCQECGKSFSQQSNLRRHQWSHAGIRRFVCWECQKTFTDKRCLVTHLKKYHDIEWQSNVRPGRPSSSGLDSVIEPNY